MPGVRLWLLAICLAACVGEGPPVVVAAPVAPASVSPWTLPSGATSSAPHLVREGRGLRLTWFVSIGEGHQLKTALYSDGEWTPPATIVSADDLFVNWADTPSVTLGGDGAWYAHFAQKSAASTYAYDVVLSRSTDGVSWTKLGLAHDDGTPSEHGFVSAVPSTDGVQLAYLDGRATGSGGAMSLRTAKVSAGGAYGGELRDDRVCDCCGTSALDVDGRLLVAYRDRSSTEIRDIRLSRGAQTSSPIGEDRWQRSGCPVNGPRLSMASDTLVAAWTTGAPGALEVRMARSTDDGRTFEAARVLASASSGPVGRVDLTPAGTDQLVVSWLDDDRGVLAARVSADLSVGGPVVLGKADAGRQSGFPRTVVVDDVIYSVWMSEAGLRGVTAPLELLPSQLRPTPAVSNRTMVATIATKRPDLAAQTVGGEPWHLADVKGPVLVALWATWCGPCRREIPLLSATSNDYGHLTVVGVAVDDVAPRVGALQQELAMPYSLVLAKSAAVREAFGTSSVPTTLLYGADGALLWRSAGELDDAGLQGGLRSLSTENAPAK